MTLSCQDLNAQLDQAEADTAAAHERRRETEEQLVRVQEELARVKSTLNGQVVELNQKLFQETQTSKQLQRDKVCVCVRGSDYLCEIKLLPITDVP